MYTNSEKLQDLLQNFCLWNYVQPEVIAYAGAISTSWRLKQPAAGHTDVHGKQQWLGANKEAKWRLV
jgi:hypothetical protein